MAEEAAQALEGTQDTPVESAPPSEDTREADAPSNEDTASQEPDTDTWEERYKHLQADHTRKAEALKEAQQYRQVVEALQSDDPQERAWAAQILNLEFEDEDEGDTSDDQEQFRDPRVDELLAEREQAAHEAQLDQLEKHITGSIDELDAKHKSNLSTEEKDLIFAAALSMPPGEDNAPDVAKAFEQYTGIIDNRIKKYRESKRDAPTPPVPGQSGSTQVQPGDRKSRLELANQVAQRALMREQ